jgi:hypothetical protein
LIDAWGIGTRVIIYNLGTKLLTVQVVDSDPLGPRPFPHYQNKLHGLAISNSIGSHYFFEGVTKSGKQLLWNLSVPIRQWKQNRIEGMRLPSVGIYACLAVNSFHNMLYVLVKDNSVGEPTQLQLWGLYLNRMKWTLLNVFKDTLFFLDFSAVQAIIYNESIYLAFLPHQYSWKLPGRACEYSWWKIGYDFKKNYNLRFLQDDCEDKVNRHLKYNVDITDYCVAMINSSTFIMFASGKDHLLGQAGSYLWLIKLESRRLHRSCIGWEQKLWIRVRSPKSQYKCVVFKNSLFLLGEKNERQNCCVSNVWNFLLHNSKWTYNFIGDKMVHYCQMCISSVVPAGPQLLVTFRSMLTMAGGLRKYELWFYMPQTKTWIFHSKMVSADEFFVFLWREKIIFFDKDFSGMSYKNLVCPPGYSSTDLYQHTCIPCPIGSYAEGGGEKKCTSCPHGLTTKSMGGSSPVNCSYCEENYCVYGDCFVQLDDGFCLPHCQCRLGFSGSRCQDSKYILLTASIIILIVLAFCGVSRLVHLWKKKRLRERNLMEQVEELTGVWQIKHNEISRMELIAAGGYGEVYRAMYRDMTVALKLLRPLADECMLWEFEREIKFMQTVRHPNIVLFLGAGRTQEDCPFIVSEFVERGTLRDLLDDESRALPMSIRIKYCLDVAKGMNFLHSLSPPRVHRDLKSDNLLISNTDIAKVTDFGLGKQILSDNTRLGRAIPRMLNRAGRRRSQDQTLDTCLPLLPLRNQDSPEALGATRWRAPELTGTTSERRFTTAADVYRRENISVRLFVPCIFAVFLQFCYCNVGNCN